MNVGYRPTFWAREGTSRVGDAVRQELSVRDYGALLWRRKWVIVAAVIILPICAVALAKRHHPYYKATATVATREGNLAATVAGIQDNSYYADPSRLAATQITLAETPAVAAQVVKRAQVKGVNPYALLGATAITFNPGADILYFTVQDPIRRTATKLANAYAKQYTVFRRQYDTQAYLQARAISFDGRRAQVAGVCASAADLAGKATQLQTLAELQTGNAVVANLALGAGKIAPNLRHEAAIGLALGLVLGIGLAFLWEAFDTRVRGPEDITRRTGLALLARIPPPPRKLAREDDLVMLEEPASVEAEAFRVLRTNLEFASLDRERAHDHDHERAREGGQVDDDREPRGRPGPRRQARRPRRPRPPAAAPRQVLRARATAGPDARRARSRDLDEATAHIALGPGRAA